MSFYNKSEVEEWLRSRKIGEGTAPKLRFVPSRVESGHEVKPDWQPRIGDRIHLVNQGGAVREVTIDSAPDRGSIFVVWPGAGVYQLCLKKGRLRKAPMWALDTRELQAIRTRFDRTPSSG